MPKTLSAEEIVLFQDRLCDAAERLFVEHGATAVTIRQLAAAVGVSPMTPYRYFTDKNAILAAVRARAFNRHAEALERAYADSPPAMRALAIAEAYLTFALENPEAYKLMFDIDQADEAQYPDLVTATERSRRTMGLHMADEIAAGRLIGDPTIVAHIYWSAFHGVLMLHFARKFDTGIDARAVIYPMLIALDNALFSGGRANSGDEAGTPDRCLSNLP